MSDYYYDPEEPKHAEAWIRDYCTHVTGSLRGKPAILEAYQQKILRESLGWKLKDTGFYKYSTVYVFIPRGNAKSTTAQWFGLYKAFGAGIQAARAYCFASSKDQASGALFQPVKEMVVTHNTLKHELQVYHNYVKDPTTNSQYKLMPANWQNAHSLIGSDYDVDELHLQPDDKLMSGVQSGKAKRTDCTPQTRIWTTAGEINTYAHSFHKYAMGVKRGDIKDDSFLPIIFGADENDDPFDPKTWEKANPGWSFINQREFKETAKRAEREPTMLNAFKRYQLNMWTGSTEAWIPPHEWKLGDGGLSFSDLRGQVCYGGLYVSSIRSICSFCLYFPAQSQLIWWFWCPTTDSNVRKLTMNGWQQWIKDRYVIEVEGTTLADDPVVERILEVNNHVNIRRIAYHRQEASSKVQKLEEAGLSMDPFSIKSYGEISAPTKELEKMLLEGKLKHGGNPVATYQVECTKMTIKDDLARPNADESRDNISGVFASIMAIGTWMDDDYQESITLSQGIEFFDIDF